MTSIRPFTASLFTHAKEKLGACHGPHSLHSQVFRFALSFRFALVSSSLAILSTRSTIQEKYGKTDGCKQSNKIGRFELSAFTWSKFQKCCLMLLVEHKKVILTSFGGLDEEFLTSENLIAFVNDINNSGEISEDGRA